MPTLESHFSTGSLDESLFRPRSFSSSGLLGCTCARRRLHRHASPTSPAPQNGTPSAAAPSSLPPDYAQEPFVIEKYYSTARFENDGTGERDLNVRIRVQSDAGVQALGELVFGYSDANEKMDVRSVVVHKADGTTVTAGPDAVKEMTAPIARDAPVYTDYKEKHITVPSLRPGDTLEYSIATQIVKAFAPNQFWFEHNFLEGTIVLDEQLEVNVPKGRAINLQSPDFRFEKADSGDRTIYRWKRSVASRPRGRRQEKKRRCQSEAAERAAHNF